MLSVLKIWNFIDFNPENAKDSNQETLFCQHLLVCALQEIGSLILSLGTTAHDLITDQSLSKSLENIAVSIEAACCMSKAGNIKSFSLLCVIPDFVASSHNVM